MVFPVLYFTDTFWMSQTVYDILVVISVAISFAGFIIRSIAIGTTPKGTSGRNTEEQVAEVLNQTGIYSMLRHPLYLGNYLMWIGIVVFTFNFYFVILVSLAFWLYYERIMFAEERFLERKFGQAYLDWSLKVPAFIPSTRNYIKGKIPFSIITVLRREYSGVLATVFSFAFVDHLRYFFHTHDFDPYRISSYALLAALILTVILRTLKHQTKLLSETGRS
jgi:protein-S-isoprenylcysteine O-methyltransferase Ste14